MFLAALVVLSVTILNCYDETNIVYFVLLITVVIAIDIIKYNFKVHEQTQEFIISVN